MNRLFILNFFEFFFKIQKYEFWKVQLCFLYLTIVGAYWVMSATIGDTLFLSKFGEDSKKMLPYVYIGISIVTVLVSLVSDRMLEHFSKLKLISIIEILLGVTVFSFRYIVKIDSGWIFYALVIWLEVCAMLTVTFAYSFIGDFFNSRDAKRVYAYINGGIAFGGILSGYGIELLVDYLAPEDLLYISAGMLFSLGFLPLLINKLYTTVTTEKEEDEETKKIPMLTLFRNPYILFLFLLVFLQVIYWVLLDFQLKSVASKQMNKEEIANFYGAYYGYLGIAQLVVQFFLVRILLNKFGIISSLFITPVIAFIGSAVFFAHPLLMIIAGANLAYLSFTETLDSPAKQLLYFPLPARIRLKAQAFSGGVLGPLGEGMGGVLLLILVFFSGNSEKYSIFIVILSALTILILFLIKPYYTDTLGASLQKKKLNPSDLAKILSSSDAEKILKEILLTGNKETVLFTLNILEQQEDISRYMPLILELTHSKDEHISIEALKLIREKGTIAALPVIEKALEDKRENVCSEAIITYSKFKKEHAFEKISPFLISEKEEIRIAVIVGLAEYSGFYGNLIIFPYLDSLLKSSNEVFRQEAAKAIGKIGGVGSGILIKKLLSDPSEAVRIQAIQSSCLVHDPVLIPELVQNLQNDALKDFSIQAIQKMPPEAVSYIKVEIQRPDIHLIDQMILLQSLTEIGGMESIQLLLEILNSEQNCILLVEAARSLDEIVNTEDYLLDKELLKGVKETIYSNTVLSNKARSEIGDTNRFYAGLYHDHLILNLTVLLHIFSIEYGKKQISNIQIQLFGNDEALKANALELLELIVDKKLEEKYLRLLNILLDKNIPEGKGLTAETIREIESGNNAWLKIITHFTQDKGIHPMETANQIDYYEIISRISFLKKVDLFANIPADYLASIVVLLKEKTFYKNEILFSQGDPGDAFYVIKSGSISVRVNGKEIAVLGEGEGIGEMALIDGESRSATAILREDSELLRLSSSDFNKLLSSYSSITIALLKTLSHRLRLRVMQGT